MPSLPSPNPPTPNVDNPPIIPVPGDANRAIPAPPSASSAARAMAVTMQSINQIAFDQRRAAVGSLDTSLKSSRDEIRQIQANAQNLRGAEHDQFKASLADLQSREAELRDRMKAAQNATPDEWTNARVQLNVAYQHYVDARARVDLEAGKR
jgi:hypothetical protein